MPGFLLKTLIGTIVFLQLSCFHKKSDLPLSQKHMTNKSPDLFALTKEWKVTCPDEESCSPSVGNFTVYDVQKNPQANNYLINFGNCTASLLSPDTVITNRHCFINDQTKAGDECPNIFIKFPKVQSYPEEIHQCREIIFRPLLNFTNDNEKYQSMDVAILKLKTSSKRPPLKVSTEGFQDKEIVTIHRFTTQEIELSKGKKERRSDLEVLHCPVVQDGAIHPAMRLASHPFSAFVYLADCPIVESNSGAPIVNGNGLIKGVINLYFDSEKIKNPFIRAEKFKDAAQGINLACVDDPSINAQDANKISHPECLKTLDRLQQKEWIQDRLLSLHLNRFALTKEVFPLYYEKSKDKFEWIYTPVQNKSNFSIIPGPKKQFWHRPKCVSNEQELKEYFESIDFLPIFNDQSFFDEYGRLDEKISLEGLKIITVITEVKPPMILLKIFFDGSTSTNPFLQNIELCKD